MLNSSNSILCLLSFESKEYQSEIQNNQKQIVMYNQLQLQKNKNLNKEYQSEIEVLFTYSCYNYCVQCLHISNFLIYHLVIYFWVKAYIYYSNHCVRNHFHAFRTKKASCQIKNAKTNLSKVLFGLFNQQGKVHVYINFHTFFHFSFFHCSSAFHFFLVMEKAFRRKPNILSLSKLSDFSLLW
ncbi:unnamed protein product [Paramecium octaurelia]|uniref:Transmembrane protein n=1 Tax=Paramecium octaurelia TaxID=43137 RepID=A0A8S1T022_PAROT|nr:unnamed protein product [Paramecium octaurelia]